MRRPRTDIRPPFGTLNANSATMQPLSNSDTDATNRHSTISQTIQQPLSSPAPTIGNLNPSTTVLQPLVGLGHAKPSSNPPTTTLQPSFVSNQRTIPTQPSFIRDPTTPTQPQPQQNGGRISPDDRREEPRDSPATKSSGCLSAKREPRRVSTDRRSLPKAVARVVPQGAERALCGVQICRAPRFSHNRVVGSHTAMRTGRRTSPNGELPPRRWSR